MLTRALVRRGALVIAVRLICVGERLPNIVGPLAEVQVQVVQVQVVQVQVVQVQVVQVQVVQVQVVQVQVVQVQVVQSSVRLDTGQLGSASRPLTIVTTASFG